MNPDAMEIADTAGRAAALRETDSVVIIVNDSRSARSIRPLVPLNSSASHRTNRTPERKSGQVAQVVERSPEKAGVGGSTPSLATIISITCKFRISLLGCNSFLKVS